MDIKLAQELKDAGYPQEVNLFYWMARPGRSNAVIYGMPSENEKVRKTTGVEFYAMPLLADLIKACGNEFEALSKRSELEWLAVSKVELCDQSQGGFGKTPEEAVARLWLLLNTKKKD
jgi:hypothetical protein